MFPGALIQLIVMLAIAGLILWAISQFPIDATIQRIIRVVIIVVVCIYLIYWLAGLGGLLASGPGPGYPAFPYRR
jgi:hypothetical protein